MDIEALCNQQLLRACIGHLVASAVFRKGHGPLVVGGPRGLDSGQESRNPPLHAWRPYLRSADQKAKHAAPAAIAVQDAIRRLVSSSWRKIRPMMAAKTTLVSRRAETAPMASYCMAQMTMP